MKENWEVLLETPFLRVLDLKPAAGRHYYEATRRDTDRMVASMSDAAFSGMIPDAVSCCVVWHEAGENPRIVLNREFRYPLGRTVLSVPAGLIDPEDTGDGTEQAVFSAAGREIYEETGIALSEKDRIRMVNPCLFSSPGLTDESNAVVRIDLYGHRKEELTQKHAEGTEKFDGFVLADREEARRMLREGGISVYTWIGLTEFLSDPE